mgnify:CR=1 FL=1
MIYSLVQERDHFCWIWLTRAWLVLFDEDIILLLFVTNNTISLLFMLILWNKSVRKYLHTLLNG